MRGSKKHQWIGDRLPLRSSIIVYCANGSDVAYTIVEGKILYARGVMRTVKKKLRRVGLDGPSVDDKEPCAPYCPIHRLLLREGVIIVENLTNLTRVKKRRFQLIALPLPIKGADAAPSRIIAAY
jgi:kynurenine formamidase